MKRIIKSSLFIIIFIVLTWAVHYAWTAFPIISGFDAKQVCTCVFVANRDTKALDTSEMAEFPFSLANYQVNIEDSSVTASVWGLAKKKAIYRKALAAH